MLISLTFALAGFSCNVTDKNEELPVVSVSIHPQKYLIEKIAGSRFQVNVMVPPGASPATYEPSLSQMKLLHRSIQYYQIGHLGFEKAWMEKISEAAPSMEIIDLSETLVLIRGEHKHNHAHEQSHEEETYGVHSGIDPHIWMSVKNMKIMSGKVLESLRPVLPGNETVLEQNHQLFISELDSLDREIERMTEPLEQRSFFIYHPALSYFARDYGLEQVSLEREGKSPSPSHMKEMTDLGLEKGIRTIFIQSQFDQNNARVLAGELEAEIVSINPLDEQWDLQIRDIANKISSAR